MDFMSLGQNTDALIAIAVIVVMFGFFVSEIYPTEVVALGGVGTLLATGVLPYEAGLEVLASLRRRDSVAPEPPADDAAVDLTTRDVATAGWAVARVVPVTPTN